MSTLYLIGNGLDLHSGLKTSYEDFHRYILENNNQLEDQLQRYFDNKTDIDLWKDFENNLSKFDSKSYYADHDHIDLMTESFKTTEAYGLHDEIEQETDRLIDLIKQAFTDWIQSIEISKKKSISIFTNGAAFITFNYTDTLEKFYDIQPQNILHIHGSTNEYHELVFGHGEKIQSREENELDQDGNSTRTIFTDARNAAQYPLHAFFKNADEVLKSHGAYFNGLPKMRVIYILGHSLGKADWPYFKKISELSPDALWKVSYYSESERNRLRETALKVTGIAEDNLKMIKMDELRINTDVI